MNKNVARTLRLRLWLVLVLPMLAGLVVPLSAQAQEQFYTQSGGRGLQNAKTNARLSKVEGDVDVLNVEMAKVQPHAKAQLGSCPDAGDKLRYTGTNWVCDRETDPTVQGFAKKALPSCTGGSILGVQGGEFSCVQSGFVSNETDPTVQGFAKSPLPNCGMDQVLSASGSALTCIPDQKGLTRETDPLVHNFARTDTNPALPNCGPNEMLSMVNGNLLCRVDSVGITQEVDPFTAHFARTDIAGYSLAACGTGEILRSVTDGANVILKCEPAGDALEGALALNDLSDVNTAGQVSGSILLYNGTEWVAGSEIDPTVPAWAKTALSSCAAGQVLTYNGTSLTCVNDAGGSADPLTFAGLDDVNVVGVSDGQFVKYDLTTQKWVPGTVQQFAQDTLPTCTTGQVLTGDGSNLTCIDDAGGAADPIDLVELGDVRTGPSTVLSPNNGEFLRYLNGKWVAVPDRLASLAAGDNGKWCYYDHTSGEVKCDRGAPLQCSTGELLSWNSTSNAFECSAASAALGLGDMALQNSNTVVIHGGTIDGTAIGGSDPAAGTFTNLRVTGNLYVSGSQSIDGVSFANGGLQATGTVSATSFSGDGSQLTGITAGNLEASGITGSVQFKGNSGEISGTGGFRYVDNSTLMLQHMTMFGEGSLLGYNVYWDQGAGTYRYMQNGQGGLVMRMGTGSGAGNLEFITLPQNNGGANAAAPMGDQRMVLTTGGNLGIGTNTPNAPLHVSGSVQIAGTVAETCDALGVGKMRVVDVGGGDVRMQVCK